MTQIIRDRILCLTCARGGQKLDATVVTYEQKLVYAEVEAIYCALPGADGIVKHPPRTACQHYLSHEEAQKASELSRALADAERMMEEEGCF